jgi:hypothetical protein
MFPYEAQFRGRLGEGGRVIELLQHLAQLLEHLDPLKEPVRMKIVQITKLQRDVEAILSPRSQFKLRCNPGEHGIKIVTVNHEGTAAREGIPTFRQTTTRAAAEVSENSDSKRGLWLRPDLRLLTTWTDVKMNLSKRMAGGHGLLRVAEVSGGCSLANLTTGKIVRQLLPDDQAASDASGGLRSAGEFMMEDHELTGTEGARRVSTAFVVAELNFEDVRRESLHDCTHLATLQVARGKIL